MKTSEEVGIGEKVFGKIARITQSPEMQLNHKQSLPLFVVMVLLLAM